MPVVFTLMSNGQTVALPDPAGGEFTAAGDFDRILPLENQLPSVPRLELPVLSRLNAYGDVEFNSEDMPAIVREATALRAIAEPGPESHGLDRLRALAEHGQRTPGAVIRAEGD